MCASRPGVTSGSQALDIAALGNGSRSVSLRLALKYADTGHDVVMQLSKPSCADKYDYIRCNFT